MLLDHVNIKAPMGLLEREKAFFCDVLGLRDGDRPDFGIRGYWLYAGDKAVVHLSEGDAGSGQGAIDHVAFRSEGVDRLVRTLDDSGTEYTTFYVADLDTTQVFVRTPSNIKVEVNFPGEQL